MGGKLQANESDINACEKISGNDILTCQFSVEKRENTFGFKSAFKWPHKKWLSAKINGAGIAIKLDHDALTEWELFDVSVIDYMNNESDQLVPSAPTINLNYNENDEQPPAYDGYEGAQIAPGATAGHVVNVEYGSEIEHWLKSIGPQFYDYYYSVFVDNGFDSKVCLLTMSDDDLQAIGVSKLGHRKALSSKIEEMRM